MHPVHRARSRPAHRGVPVVRVLTDEADGHRLNPGDVPDDADLVVVGNPTNPTGVLHPAGAIAALARPGRVVLVDEAFADALPGEPESLAAADLPGLLVFRSLTKTWALAGLRAGYALGDPALLPARPLPAAVAGLDPRAGGRRRLLHTGGRRGVRPRGRRAGAPPGHAGRGTGGRPRRDGAPRRRALPAVAAAGRAGRAIRAALRAGGVAVRRGDTFPGLSADHVRVAVRPAAQVQQLVRGPTAALAEVAA